ncbi:MAG TPA: AAA family ATPase, partial [Pyrinomonadaceae bacterium]|nr:AAA family ATPase [Pyrinomonadaceae bacterium]
MRSSPDTTAEASFWPETPISTRKDEVLILREKLTVPSFDRTIERPRLHELLSKSLSNCCATLVSGRAGTGKSALAAGFAKAYSKVAWYTIESSDVDWEVFAAHFAAAISSAAKRPSLMRLRPENSGGLSGPAIDSFIIDTFGHAFANQKKPMLIVLDNLHRIFDADWFGDFFNMLIYSLPENMHLLLLCRSKPPAPLWRLRSKQMLNVVDEKLLAFDEEETSRLFENSGLKA